LCDERPTQDTVEWCERAGVRISSRYGRADYHRSAWPRRTRCKEGNLSFFYDSWGYENYDVVAQLDCDHVPGRSYLREMVRPFADHAVGYVAAPSVCDSNEAESWAARGRTHREATFDGPSQTGHNGGLAPVCIGSHYAVRTAALREIGGLGPELAEDFSTSFLLNSAGWEGVFAIDAEAHGEGPNTFAAMITQEYQWARSLVTLLCDLVPRHLPRLPWRLRVRYLYALLYYPSITVAMVAAVLLPPIAAVTGVAWVHVTYSSFLLHWWPVAACVVAITLLLRRRRMLRPRDAPILSWELWLYVLARWPWIAWGVVAALLQKVRPRPVGFHVTPKGPVGLQPLPARLVAPYVVIAVALALAAIAGERVGHSAGYLFLTVIAAGSYTAVALAVSMLHAVEAARAAALAAADALATVRAPLLLTAGAGALLTFAIARFPFGALSGALW
jgi:cellulose synthase/poly-beta-1,6-N-acetylglucosamine synthase-like glycosyltransferase